MQVIPVIDILGGQAVRAVRGERSAYRPIQSALCESSEPLHVARILLEHCSTRKLYVADLDALLGRAPQTAVVTALLTGMPQLELWLDGGFATRGDAVERLAASGAGASRVTPVFGSESLRSHEELARCFSDGAQGILSLDLRKGRPLGPASCWSDPSLWPERVIVMTLDRVGAFAGPDLQTLAEVRARAPAVSIIGAGGIRDADDLVTVARAGAHAWLVASAIHDLRISRDTLRSFGRTLSTASGHDAMAPSPFPVPKERLCKDNP
jgi:HisA/HisF family protein